jgi:hypothetical protein
VLINARIGACLEKKYLHNQQVSYLKQIEEEKARVDNLLNVIIAIGIVLSAETDREHLLEPILVEAMLVCRADGGTLYLCADDCLKSSIMRTDSLGIEIPFPALRLYDEKTGAPNRRNIATHAALIGLHIGDLILGTIGGENRMGSTVISNAVNLAACIEGMTKIYGISLPISEQNVFPFARCFAVCHPGR